MPPVFLDLTIEKPFESEVRTETYSIGTEGGTVGNPVGSTRSGSSHFSVRWDGDRLRIDTKNYPTRDMSVYTEHDETWSLDEQGRLLIAAVDRQSDSDATTRTLTYRRQ